MADLRQNETKENADAISYAKCYNWMCSLLYAVNLLTAALVFSFVRSIIGLRGGKKTQMAQKEPAEDVPS